MKVLQDAFDINGSFVTPEKSVVLNLLRLKQIFVWICVIMVIIVICLLKNVKEIYKFKDSNKNVNFPT